MGRRTLLAALALALAACGGGEEAPTAPPAGAATVKFPAARASGSAETLTLEGAVFGPGSSRTAVVLAHAFPENQGSWATFAREVAGRGFTALTFNFRGYGLSQGDRDPSRADLDLEGAVEEAKRRGATAVVVVGASMGGTAAIILASRTPLAGVVAVSAPQAFRGLDARGAVSRARAPLLLIAAEGDPNRAAANARALFAAAPQPKRLEVIRGSRAHGTDLLLDPRAAERVESLITSFIAEHRG